ncbi:hypothetical protein AB835_13910 [Candidatus Endobugula sertula]|uniref:Uncharacterized protein n=1 Tax=Candidatus Endobugula sertula TaxID=62101 RepID=A0A1D2QLN1_9GAMM|nr:hypothetical protein AB835_13910 [Candidatus Endobugula sertula]
MNYKPQTQFTLTDPAILLSGSYYRRLWLTIKNIPLSRREWLDTLANMLRDYDGMIYTEDGQLYEFPFIDDVFANDADMRWISYYLEPDETGFLPRSKSRKIERLQLLDLYCRIKLPDIARHFAR